MIRAKVTISQKVKFVKTFEVKTDNYFDLYQEAVSEAGMCLREDYDDFYDYNLESIEIISEE